MLSGRVLLPLPQKPFWPTEQPWSEGVDDDGVVEAAVLFQPVQQAAYFAVDFGNGGVVADVACANLLVGGLKAAGEALVCAARDGGGRGVCR